MFGFWRCNGGSIGAGQARAFASEFGQIEAGFPPKRANLDLYSV
jgi:hypothetical protein